MSTKTENMTAESEVKEPVVKMNSKDKEIADLKAQINSLMALVATMAQNNKTQPVQQLHSNEVNLVYMSDSDGVIISGELELVCSRFGETFSVSRNQFDAIVGKYRKWFDDGILAVAPENIDVAAAKGIKTSDEYALSVDSLNKIGKMSPNELEQLWNKVDTDSQKLTIVQYFKRKFMEGVEPGFQDRAKIELLNRLTNGGLKREVKEISGDELKILPTVM